jgi:hypothetical protein
MKSYKMIGYNDEEIVRIRYCFAIDYLDAKRKFNREFWYLRIAEITECPASEVQVIGMPN